MRKSVFFIVLLMLAANSLGWYLLNRSIEIPGWTGNIQGFSFSPYADGQNPLKKRYPQPADIAGDLDRLSGLAASVRTYSSTDGLENIPRLAGERGLRVTAGAWLDKDLDRNSREIDQLVANANSGFDIERLLVGNECLLRNDLGLVQLKAYIAEVRDATELPVSTAEPWHVWLKYPDLADAVDFITIHVLPYWEGIPASEAPAWTMERYRQVQAAFPDKKVIIGEVGWPSGGAVFGQAIPSVVNQARFVREFLGLAAEGKVDYFLMEAFDQPWKKALEGRVGAYWGMFDKARHLKYPLDGPMVPNPLWGWQALFAGVLAIGPMILFLTHWLNLRFAGRLFFPALVQLASSLLAWTLFLPWTSGFNTVGLVIWTLLLPAQGFLLIVILTNGLELTEMLWIQRWRRRFVPQSLPPDGAVPKVSIHLAIYNEPPELVFQTLDGLARLDYPDYEVLVVDNNTAREEIWRPVESYCANLGPRFRFFHLPKWPGYKAGALNYALSQTDPGAEVVGVIDSDYVVSPDWLRSLVPYFEKKDVAFVQAPQDNREWQADLFKTMINWEYNGFFQIGMVHRNERNAIIQHGTMTLVRREALEGVGAWGEWCICEDAELGLRLFAAGYEGVYVNHIFGVGVVPTSFAAYKGQRFRWTYGAVQILRRHWRTLLPWRSSGLDLGQKFHFVTGWFPWFTDAMHLVFTFAGIFWTLGLLLFPDTFDIPLKIFLLPTLGMFLFKILHALLLYRAKVSCTFLQSLGAAVAGMGLTHSIARAVFNGLWTSSKPFLRTPKGENRPALVQAFLMAWEEAQILTLLLFTAVVFLWRYGMTSGDALLWAGLLTVQAFPYAAALATSIAGSMPRLHLVLPERRSAALRWWWQPNTRRTPLG